MKTYQLEPLPSLQDFPPEEQTASLKLLLAICQRQQEALISQAELLSLQSEQLQQLRDEISRLKGGNQRPKNKAEQLRAEPQCKRQEREFWQAREEQTSKDKDA